MHSNRNDEIVTVAITRVRDGFEDLPLPEYATSGAAGMDLRAAIETPLTLDPSERRAVPTGFAVALPRGFEMQVRPRSGLAIRHGLTMINAPGTVDEDFRGEVHVLLVNLGTEPYTIQRGDRIAQGVIARYERIDWLPVEQLESSERGEGGFGSTGRS